MNKKDAKGKENNDKSKADAIDKSAKKDPKGKDSNNDVINQGNKSATKAISKDAPKKIEDKPNEEDEKNANAFNMYLEDSGLPEAFQLIFSELIAKKINPQNYFNYVSMRLRQIGKEINELKNIDEDNMEGNMDDDNMENMD